MMGLYRSGTDTIVFGVCGGLAEVLHVRPTVLRLAFSLLALASGIGIILYVILALILPLEGRGSNNLVETFQNNLEEVVATFPARRRTLGIVLIVGGALFFLAQSGFFAWLKWNTVVPLLLIVVGVALFWKNDG
jgi:phage shock protein C